MPPKRKRRVAFVEPENENELEDAELNVRHIEITPQLIAELKAVDISNYPIPEKYGAAYKDNGQERLIIHKMVLENFKSYYGVQVVGPFHAHFSAIVGANGSGKSNIIDALMFVFGSRVSRIRSSNVKALIHKSATAKNLEHCSVTIHFQSVRTMENGEHIAIPGSVFTIKRTVRKEGASKYYYNDRPVGRNALRDSLRNHGIDMDHNRFLILQGEVELISTMKPKGEKEGDEGLLEYLDDIVGTSRLKEKVKDLDMKVTAVFEEKQRRLMSVNKANERKQEIVKPVREMVKLLIMENRLAHCNHKLLCTKIYRKRKHFDKNMDDAKKAAEDKHDKEQRYEALREATRQARTANIVKQKELEESQHSLRQFEKNLETERMKNQKVALAITNAEKRLKDKEKERKNAADKLKKIETDPSKNDDAVDSLTAELEDARQKKDEALPKYHQALSLAKTETTNLESKQAEIGSRLADAKKLEDEANAKLQSAQFKQVQAGQTRDRAKTRYDEGVRTLAEVEEKLEDYRRRHTEVENKLPELESKANSATAEFEEVRTKEFELARSYDDLKKRHQHATQEQHHSKQSNRTLSMLMEQKRNGNIPGIFGRLGDLGNIDSKYDVAVSSNFGGQLDHVVVDTYQTFQLCTRFLNSERLNRMNFTILDKIGYLTHNMRPVTTPNNLPRLFDLVKPVNDELRLAFYKCFGNALVCDTISTARQVSQNRWKVVAMNGDVVNPSGTITGGGNRVIRGKIGTNMNQKISVSDAEIRKLKQEFENVNAELSSIRKLLGQLDSKKRNYDGDLERERKAFDRLCDSIRTCENDLIVQKRLVAELKNKLDLEEASFTQETIDSIMKEVDALMEVRDNAVEHCAVIQSHYDEVTSQISTVLDSVAGTAKAEYEKWSNLEKEIVKKRDELHKASSKAKIELTKLAGIISSAEKAIEGFLAEVEKLREDFEESNAAILRVKEMVEDKQDCVTNLQIELDDEAKKSDQFNEEEVKLKQEIAELTVRQSQIEERIRKEEAKLELFEQRLQSLKLHDVSDLMDDDVGRNRNNVSDDDNTDSESDESDEDSDEFSVHEDEEEEIEDDDVCDADEARRTEFSKFTDEELETADIETLERELATYEDDRKRSKATVSLHLLEDYRKRLSDFKDKEHEFIDICKAYDNVQTHYDRFINQRREEFNDALAKINEHLKNQYYALSLGGEAYLQAVCPLDAYAEGIKFIVRPRAKGWREIGMTSGGEKTISSLSLVFALHQFDPTPFYVMDEIDAALDFRNVAMISRFVKEKTKNSQFIIISLRNNMYQVGNRLIGVYKVHDKATTMMLNQDHAKASEFKKQRRRSGDKERTIIMPA